MWNVSVARFSKRHNCAAERNLARGLTYEAAKALVIKYEGRPVYAWEDNAANICPMEWAMVVTDAYTKEHKRRN